MQKFKNLKEKLTLKQMAFVFMFFIIWGILLVVIPTFAKAKLTQTGSTNLQEKVQTLVTSTIDASSRKKQNEQVNPGSTASGTNSIYINNVHEVNATGSAVSEKSAANLAEAVKLTYTIHQATHGPGINVWGEGFNNDKKRSDFPIIKDKYTSIMKESPLWASKATSSGWSSSTTSATSESTYSYLTSELYGQAYEQGQNIAITNVSKRFTLSQEAIDAGWKVLGIVPTNLPYGLTYDSSIDTIFGQIKETQENGVYDDRFLVYVTNGSETHRYFITSYQAGGVFWKDTQAPSLLTTDEIVDNGNSLDLNINYFDNSSSLTSKGEADIGKYVTTNDNGSITVKAGKSIYDANSQVIGSNNIPGVTYTKSYGSISGITTKSGIFSSLAVAQDFDSKENNEWSQSSQEANESLTLTVRPSISIENVNVGDSSIPVTVSNGTTKVSLTLPDEKTVEAELDSNSKWKITGGTSAAAKIGTEVGSGTTLSIPATPSSISFGIYNINATATAENVTAILLTESINLTSSSNENVVAKLNKDAGRWVPSSVGGMEVVTKETAQAAKDITDTWIYLSDNSQPGRVFCKTNNPDGGYSVRTMEIRNELATTDSYGSSTGINKYRIFEYDQTYSSTGEITAVNTYRTDSKEIPTIVTVSYDAQTDTWTSSDSSTVSAIKAISEEKWATGDDGYEHTANKDEKDIQYKTTGNGITKPVYKCSDKWTISTSSGFKGVVNRVSNKTRNYASVKNSMPTASATSYTSDLNNSVNLIDSSKVTYSDKEDTASQKQTIISKVTVTDPEKNTVEYEPKEKVTAWKTAVQNLIDKEKDLFKKETELNESINTKNTTDATIKSKITSLSTEEEKLNSAQNEFDIASSIVDNGGLTGDELVAAQAKKTKTSTELNTIKASVESIKSELADLQTEAKSEESLELEKYNACKLALQELKEDESLVDAAREAIKEEASTVLSDITDYKLSLIGTYKITVYVLDSSSNLKIEGLNKQLNSKKFYMTGDIVYTEVSTSYNLTSNPLDIKGDDVSSYDIQGASQSATPSFTFTDDTEIFGYNKKTYSLDSTEAKDKDDNIIGSYSINSSTGEVTFTPNKDFTGTPKSATITLTVVFGDEAPQITKQASITYTPRSVGVTPEGIDTTTKWFQGDSQSAKVVFTPGSVEIEGVTKTVEIDTTSYRLLDKDQNEVRSTEAYASDGTTIVGTYSITSDGTVNFTPTKEGKAYQSTLKPATVQVKDLNGTKATANWTPEIVPITPSAKESATSGNQGAKETSKVDFDSADTDTSKIKFFSGSAQIEGQTKTVGIDKSTLTLLDANDNPVTELSVYSKDSGKKIGTYKLVKSTSGTYEVTFIPTAEFTGVVEAVKVRVADENRVMITTTYTPTVTQVKAEGYDKEITGKEGEIQKGTPDFIFNDDSHITNKTFSFEDDKTTITVDGEGKYSIDTNTGEVTFEPVYEFIGRGTGVVVELTAILTAEDGTTTTVYSSAKLTPNVEPIKTKYVDTDRNEIPGYPEEEGVQPKKDIPGYDYVKTETDQDKNILHIYRKQESPSPTPTPTPSDDGDKQGTNHDSHNDNQTSAITGDNQPIALGISCLIFGLFLFLKTRKKLNK